MENVPEGRLRSRGPWRHAAAALQSPATEDLGLASVLLPGRPGHWPVKRTGTALGRPPRLSWRGGRAGKRRSSQPLPCWARVPGDRVLAAATKQRPCHPGSRASLGVVLLKAPPPVRGDVRGSAFPPTATPSCSITVLAGRPSALPASPGRRRGAGGTPQKGTCGPEEDRVRQRHRGSPALGTCGRLLC